MVKGRAMGGCTLGGELPVALDPWSALLLHAYRLQHNIL